MNIEVDGNEDYSKFTSAELAEVIDNIDRNRYPKNYSNLQRQIASRSDATASQVAVPIDPRNETRRSHDERPAMDMKSGNPALSVNTFDGFDASDDPMTMAGTINKTAILLAIVIIGAGSVWNIYFSSHEIADVLLYLWVGVLGGALVSVLTIRYKQISPYTALIYALLEGMALGGLSTLYEARQPGIAPQAVGLTFAVLACMLAAYRFGIIKVTEKLMIGLFAATGGILILYMIDLLFIFFGHPIAMIHEGGYLGILLSLFVVSIAALTLVMDFDFIARGVASRSPKYMEWYSAFGLIVTLVWLYLEILRLLGKRR